MPTQQNTVISVSSANFIIGALTIVAQAAIVVCVAGFFTKNKVVLGFFSKYAFLIGFTAALAATLGSLFYSEIAGYEPCTLCWLQRVFIFPQAIILGIALWIHDRAVARYAIVLSAIGAVIAGYQHLLQVGAAPALPCAAVGSVSCSQRFVMQFGYITIPLMAFTVFMLILVSMIAVQRHRD